VKGVFAELGVYKGETAKILHHIDPDRDLHLFDTFTGFTQADLAGERGEAAQYTGENFSDTSLEKVRMILGESPKIHYHPGHFPATTAGLEDMAFALVSLDADLYKPTLAGLHYFYPRLSKGGVILVHDYNFRWEGIKRAVDEFCVENATTFVLLPDRDGTIVITRP
jgi:O-methyltransferase